MNTECARIFSRLVMADRAVHIKLLGDSITHGVGGTGFDQNGEPITKGFARNPDGFCWAKMFKEHMESAYNCTVTNNACTGTDIKFILERFDELVSPEDDIVICTIGTNNRHFYHFWGEKPDTREFMDAFYKNILTLNAKFKEAGKAVVFVANIPASADAEKDGDDYWRLFHMNDVHDLYLKASFEGGFALISLYKAMKKYCRDKNITLDSLLADGLHPNDEGYRVMYDLLMDEIGLA